MSARCTVCGASPLPRGRQRTCSPDCGARHKAARKRVEWRRYYARRHPDRIAAAERQAARLERDAEIACRYLAGESSTAIARHTGLTVNGVLKVLERRGVPRRPRTLMHRNARTHIAPATYRVERKPTPSHRSLAPNGAGAYGAADVQRSA